MIENQSFKFKGSAGKLITADLSFKKYQESVPIVVFAHGFKGFKDWGAWPLAAQIFALKGLPFFKFNFSHNGTSPNHLSDFVDLDAFANNTISRELEDLGLVLDFIEKKAEGFDFDWDAKIYLIGHSRGGGISLLLTAQDPRIQKCACWASVSNFDNYLILEDPKKWKKAGAYYIDNLRTNQKMPIGYQLYEDLVQHKGKLSILEQIEDIEQDLLIIHGDKDETVPLAQSESLYNAVPHAIRVIIENANHTFNTKHPLEEKKIPLSFAQVIEETIEFFSI